MSPISQVSETFFEVRNASVSFETGVKPFEHLDLAVRAGEFLSLLGPSGCGKSTLLRLVAGLQMPSTGQIHFHSHDLRRAFVFQEAHLLPWRTVLENVCLPLEFQGSEMLQEKARECLARVGLSGVEHFFPHQLSGGMKMRVSLARALMTDPTLLLLDEPFAALDEMSRQKLDEDLRSLWLEKRMTVLFVTHNVSEAAFLSTRTVILSQRPARIVFDEVVDLPSERTRALKFEERFTKVISRMASALEAGAS